LFGFIRGEVGGGQIQVQEILSAGQVQSGRWESRSFPLFEDVGDIFATVGLEGQRVLESAVNFLRTVDFAQGDDFLDVVRRVEALVLQLAGVSLGVRTQGQEGQQKSLVAGFFALYQQILGMIGIGHVLAAVVTAGMSGDEFFVVKEQQLIGVELEGELLRGVEGRHRIAVGGQDNATTSVGANGSDDGTIVGHDGQGLESRFFLGE